MMPGCPSRFLVGLPVLSLIALSTFGPGCGRGLPDELYARSQFARNDAGTARDRDIRDGDIQDSDDCCVDDDRPIGRDLPIPDRGGRGDPHVIYDRGTWPDADDAAPCQSECDCPFDQNCVSGSCADINSVNSCCFNDAYCDAYPGYVCEYPDNSFGVCPVPTDGGPARDIGPRDGPVGWDFGVNDRGSGSDGPLVSDYGPRDVGFLDGPAIDSGRVDASIPRDTGVRDASTPDGGQGAFCNTDCDCDAQSGYACVQHQCWPISSRQNMCCSAPSCPWGQRCVDPDGTMHMCGGAPVGDPCGRAADCSSIGICIDRFPNGYCTQDCAPRGPTPLCPSDATCRRIPGGGNFCFDVCQNNGECRPEYRCIQLGINDAERVCWPLPPGSTNPNGLPVGSACSNDNACDVGMTCARDGPPRRFPGGYCTFLYCDSQTNPCPSGSLCYAFPGALSMCLDDCPNAGGQSTCRTGYFCLGPQGGSGVCIPR